MLDSFATVLSTLGVAAGLGAAAGLRVFVPLFVASLACALGVITPGHGMEWIGSWWAVSAFGVLSLVEVVAFHVPWVDHALDALATPLAVISGTLVAAVPLLHALGEQPRVYGLAADTDGIDGTQDNAGAMFDPLSLSRAGAKGLRSKDHLLAHDAWGFFDASGDLVYTGPTGTNVNDFRAVLVTA